MDLTSAANDSNRKEDTSRFVNSRCEFLLTVTKGVVRKWTLACCTRIAYHFYQHHCLFLGDCSSENLQARFLCWYPYDCKVLMCVCDNVWVVKRRVIDMHWSSSRSQWSSIQGSRLLDTRHCYQQWSCAHYSTPHIPWGCTVELASLLTVATILADAAVIPPSPKWHKMYWVGC